MKKIKLEFFNLNKIQIKKIEKRIRIKKNRGNTQLIRFNASIYIEEGDVIKKDKKLYYVYAEDNVNIYCFRIQKKRKEEQKLEKIKINRKTYYTNFKELRTIKRNDEIEISNIASKEEILLILGQKKSLKEKAYPKIEEIERREKDKFEIGSIFEYGNSTVMYLYSKNSRHYGVDLLWYSIKTRIFEIKGIEQRKLIGTKNLEEINKILEFLIEKNIQKLSAQELIFGSLGTLIGLIIAAFIVTPFSGIFSGIHPAIGPIIFVLLELIAAIIGAEIFIKKKDDIYSSLSIFKKNNLKEKDKKNPYFALRVHDITKYQN